MNIRDYELELLMKQREALEKNIKDINGNMFKVVIAVFPIAASFIVSYLDLVSEQNGCAIRFAIIEIIFLISMIICSCLFAANVDRDYISAIDDFLCKEYNISVLFNNGKLSRKHITGFKSIFAQSTLVLGISAIEAFALLFAYIIITDFIFYKKHFILLVVLISQLAMYIVLLCLNVKRKTDQGQADDVYQDCIDYLSNSKMQGR